METLANVHPGEILMEEFLKPMNISAYKLSKDIGIPQTRTSAILKGQRSITADTALIRKIDINTVTFKDLLKHPYFEYYLVKAIFNMKDELKHYDSIGQLRSLPVMYEELYEKISPYLEVK